MAFASSSHPDVPARPALVIFGMHRSGTSVLAQAMHALGCAAPADRATPPAANPLGFVESAAVIQLNNRILNDLSSSWDDARLLSVRGQAPYSSAAAARASLAERYMGAAERAVATAFDGRSGIILNEAQICLFPEVWDAGLRRAGYSPHYLLIFRNPLEVGQSLKARNGVAVPRAQQLWLRYNLGALTQARAGQLFSVMSFEELLANPDAMIDKLWRMAGQDQPVTPEMRAAFAAVIDAGCRHHVAQAVTVQRSPLVPQATKRLHMLLTGWDRLAPDERLRIMDEAERDCSEFALLSGSMIAVASSSQPVPAAPATPPGAPLAARAPQKLRGLADPASGRRKLLLHYHLFKNAGTSVDAVLSSSFGPRWITQEFDTAHHADQQQGLARMLAEHPEALALSSHTLLLPLPQIDGLEVLPVLFVRHPMDRLKSAYDFEKDQGADTLGSRLARQTDFAGYLRGRLANVHDRACRNFQAHRLAMGCAGHEGTEQARAISVAQRLPFLGLVEAFGASMERLEGLVTPLFPAFKAYSVRKNATSAHSSLDQRLAGIRTLLGDSLYDEVLEANTADLALHAMVSSNYAA